MSSLTPESRARSIRRLVLRECCFEGALNVFEKIVVRLQGLQNSKSNHIFTPRAVPLYPDDTTFQRSL